MSDLLIKTEIRKMLRTSGQKVNHKMVCPILKLFEMKYGEVDRHHISSIAVKLINEH